MDAEDAKEIHERLSNLENGQGNSFEANRKQIEIVNSTVFELEQAERIIQQNEEVLLNTTKQLASRLNARLTRDDLDEHFMILEAVFNNLINDAKKIKQLLIDEEGKLIKTGVFTETKLLAILIKAKLPKGLSFPVEFSIKGMHQLEKISTVSIHGFQKKIVTLVEIPLVDFQVFEIYKPHSVPVKTTDKFWSYLATEFELLVIHGATQRFIPMSTQQLEKCGKIHGQYVCTEILPTQVIRSNSPCEVQMFGSPNTLPNTCNPVHIPIEHLMLIHLNRNNAWIYVSPYPEEITIRCEETEKREILKNSGILQISDHCEIIAADFNIKGRKSSGIKLDLHVHPKMNLTLNQNVYSYLSKNEKRIKDIHLTNVIQNMDQLKGIQLRLGLEQKELEKNIPNFDYRDIFLHPSSIYSTVMMIVCMTAGIIIFCWCRRPQMTVKDVSRLVPAIP